MSEPARLPRVAWWILAPLAWIWQYLAYVPTYKALNMAITTFWAIAVWAPGLDSVSFNKRPRLSFETRPGTWID